MRGRKLARIAAVVQLCLLAGALVVPSVVAAAAFGFTVNAPTVSTLQYSDFTDFRGSYTCVNDGSGTCPTSATSRTATFSIRPSGGSTFTDVGTVTNSFSFPSSCSTTCTFNFSLTWKAGFTLSGKVPPGVYDIGLTTSIAGGQQILLGGVTVTQEGTTTTYAGDTSAAADTDLNLGATVADADLGLTTGTGIYFPDSNLMAGVTFELFDATNTTSVAGPASGFALSSGSVFLFDTLHLPLAGGTYILRTTYAGTDYYTGSSDVDAITVNGSNTPPVLSLPGTITEEATSPDGATVSFTVSATDAEDDPDPTPVCDHASGTAFPIGDTTVSCSVTDAGSLQDTGSFTVRVQDTTDPVVVISTAESDNGAGWYNAASNDGAAGVTVDVSTSDVVGPTYLACTDNGNSVGSLPASGGSFVLGDGSHAVECTVSDWAGNVGSDSASFDVDQTAPDSISFLDGGLIDGASYVFGSVPAGPTGCSAADSVSGLASCDVSGYSDLVGAQTVTAAAVDNAGNSSSVVVSYTVQPWTLIGFSNPVSSDSTNMVKAGSNVNLKFEVFADATELTTLEAVIGLYQIPAACGIWIPMGPPTPAVSAKGNGLRYDTNSGQFLDKWEVPSSAGTCWIVSVVTADGSSLSARFQTK